MRIHGNVSDLMKGKHPNLKNKTKQLSRRKLMASFEEALSKLV